MAGPDVEVRLARPSDLRRLAAIEDAGAALFRERFGDATPAALLEPAPDGSERIRTGFLLVAVVGRSTLAGFAHVVDVDGEAHLEQLSVHPDHGRRGIGTRLVRAAMEEARWAGYGTMTLTTYRDVPWNGPFYARRGFAVVEHPEYALTRMRERERALGLDDVGPRIVMRAPLRRPAGSTT